MFNIYRYISNIACSANGPSILLVNWQLSMWCSINHSLLLAIQSCSCWTPIYGVLIYIYICMAINVNIFGVHLTIHSCCFCLNIYIFISNKKRISRASGHPSLVSSCGLPPMPCCSKSTFFWTRSSWRRQWRRSFTSWRSGESEAQKRIGKRESNPIRIPFLVGGF